MISFRNYTRKMGASFVLVMTVFLLGGASKVPDHENHQRGQVGGVLATMIFSEIQWQERGWYVEEGPTEFCLMLVCTLSSGCQATIVTNKKDKTIQVREGGHATICRDVVTFSDS